MGTGLKETDSRWKSSFVCFMYVHACASLRVQTCMSLQIHLCVTRIKDLMQKQDFCVVNNIITRKKPVIFHQKNYFMNFTAHRKLWYWWYIPQGLAFLLLKRKVTDMPSVSYICVRLTIKLISFVDNTLTSWHQT